MIVLAIGWPTFIFLNFLFFCGAAGIGSLFTYIALVGTGKCTLTN